VERSSRASGGDDIRWYYTDNYVAQGGSDKDIDFSTDEMIAGAVAA